MTKDNFEKIEQQLKDWYLFPVWPNEKIPMTKNGFKDARKGELISKFKGKCNVAVACEKSNLFVIDIDVNEEKGKNGFETIAKLEEELGKLPRTLKQTSPSGGIHYFYKATGIVEPKKGLKDVDFKYNGYVLVYPSTINGKSYKFTDGFDENGNFVIAELPQKWIDYINKPLIPYLLNDEKKHKKIINGDFKKMYDKCDFVKYCIDNAEFLEEPLWFDLAIILTSFPNGFELFNEYSKPYYKYNYNETVKKFKNAQNYNINCNGISKNFSGCETCPYSICAEAR